MSDERVRLSRRFAGMLVRQACVVMPASRQPWAEAMHNELSHVPDDWEALRWSLGCFLAAHTERIRALRVMEIPAVRVVASLVLLSRALDAMFATALTMVYRMSALGMTERLGRMTPGDGYQRLVPLMEAIPFWLHGLCVVAGGLYLAGIASLVLRHRCAYLPVVLAIAIETTATVLGQQIAASVGVAANPNPSILAAYVLPVVLPLLVALAIWSGRRRDADPLLPAP